MVYIEIGKVKSWSNYYILRKCKIEIKTIFYDNKYLYFCFHSTNVSIFERLYQIKDGYHFKLRYRKKKVG